MNLLTRQQAAERLGVNINTIDNERKAGRLAYTSGVLAGKFGSPNRQSPSIFHEQPIRRYLKSGLFETRSERNGRKIAPNKKEPKS